MLRHLYSIFLLHFIFVAILISAEWYEYNGSCYTMPSQKIQTFDSSVAECAALGSYLAELDTLEELSYLQMLVNGSLSSFWFGISYKNSTGKFEWIRSLQEPTATMWLDGEPNFTGLCVRLTTEALLSYPPDNPKNIYLLADNPCNFTYRSLCEKPADLKQPVYYSKGSSFCKGCCPIVTETTKSKLNCASTCSKFKECIGFQFTQSTMTCQPIIFNTTCSLPVTTSTLLYKIIRPRC